jgi:hypothetical protein
MNRKEKKEKADITRMIYKHMIGKIMDDGIGALIEKKGFDPYSAIEIGLNNFNGIIEAICKKEYKHAHLIRQAAVLFKKDLEELDA